MLIAIALLAVARMRLERMIELRRPPLERKIMRSRRGTWPAIARERGGAEAD
jgi:hypothetical protein